MNQAEYTINEAYAYLTTVDPVLKNVASHLPPIEILIRPATFSGLTRIIINQQLSGAASRTIFNRLETLMGGRISSETAIETNDQIYYEAGISRAKTSFIKNVGEVEQTNPKFFRELAGMTNEEIHKRLTRIKGIGDWSARIFLIFHLGRSDVFAFGDATVMKAIKILYSDHDLSSNALLEEFVSRWSPYKSAACLLMWKWVDHGMPTKDTPSR
jgi:DNA-3-methyladenine glycosylase II